jgi:hypothetical protein
MCPRLPTFLLTNPTNYNPIRNSGIQMTHFYNPPRKLQ